MAHQRELAPTFDRPESVPASGYRFGVGRFLLWLPIYLTLGVAGYALSAGPLYWRIFAAYHADEPSLLAVLYLPLVWLSQSWDAFGRWMDWYVGLWVL